MIEIRVLGPIQGFRDHERVDLGGPTQRRLLAALLARPGETVAVATLLDDLWGDDPPPSGPQSIQSYVSRLRRTLGSGVIETRSPGYRLGSDGLRVDGWEFLEMAAELPSEPVARMEAIDRALDLWAGPAFEDFDNVAFAARRLDETRLELEEDRARLLARSGRTAEALATLERITSTEPLRESAWLSLARILASTGRQAEAVRKLDRYRETLAEIGLEPGPDFTGAQDEIFDSPQMPVSSQLPHVETSFVGRETELERLGDLLDRHRLVTITGPGGMGKSRLAIEVLRDWSGLPISVARLASLRSDGEVAPTVLTAVGGETRGDPLDAAVVRIARAPTLVLLDNAEHVVDAVANLATVLLARTEARMLITSREPLNVPSEVVLTLDSLSPDAAIALFRDRARQVLPGFHASEATLDMLCEELDYMPLAIEMAAARSKALSPGEILDRLSRRYGLLDRPMRGGTGRHRSLDALVDWSYGLLGSPGQRVFERISVVAGSFDIDLASRIAGFGEVGAPSVAGILADLVEKSLLRRTESGRFRLLRVLRSFAGQKLAEGEDEEETRTRHSVWFAELASLIGNGLSTPEETAWIETANEALEDLEAALVWAVEQGDKDTAQTILEGLFDWFYHRQPPSIVDWGDLALPISADHDLSAVASAWASLAAMKRGQISEAGELALEGTGVGGSAARFAWFMTGEVACYQDRLEDALDAYRKQLIRASNLDDRIGVVDAMAGETLALAFQGVFDRAIDIAGDLEKMTADIGAPTYRAYSQYALGEAIVESEPERAAKTLQRAATLAESVNNQYIEAMARTTLGSVMARLGRFEEATSNLHKALERWETLGMPAYHWAVVQYLGAILAETGEPEPAAQLLAAAKKAGRRPFGAGQSHWLEVVDELQRDERYEQWAAEGSTMDLSRATEVAVAATRLRR